MRRRQKGTGTIIRNAYGWYCGRITRNGKVQVIKLSKNQREAESLWREWLLNNPPTPKGMSAMHSLDDAWVELECMYRARTTSARAIATYKHHFLLIRDWMLKRGKKNLEEITTADLTICLAETTEGKRTGTKRRCLAVMKGLFKVALPDAKNPAEPVKVGFMPQTSREPFTDDELEQILTEAGKRRNGIEFEGIIRVALYTGLRRKDCVYLNKSSIKDDVIMLVPHKTAKKDIVVRIPLHPGLKSFLETITPDEKGFYFPHVISLYKTKSLDEALYSIFCKVVETSVMVAGSKNRIPVKTFHSLRATFLTRLAQKGVSLPIMESMAGHLNIKQTMHYIHPDEDVKKAAIDVLSFGDEADDKIFLHPDVKKLMDEFEKQKQEFLAKIEEKIGELTRDEGKTPPRDGLQALLTRVDVEGEREDGKGKNDELRRRILRDVLRRVGMQLDTGAGGQTSVSKTL